MGTGHGVSKNYKKGKIQSEEVCLLGSTLKQKIFFTDKSYSLVEEESANWLKVNNYKTIKEYNSKGDLVQTITIGEDGKAVIKNKKNNIVFEGGYDCNNKKKHGIDCKDYNSKGEVIFKGEYKDGFRYNSDNNTEDLCIEYGKKKMVQMTKVLLLLKDDMLIVTDVDFFIKKEFLKKEKISQCDSKLPLTETLFLNLKVINDKKNKEL